MDLYSYVSIESFVRGCKESKTPGTFTLHVPNLLYAKSDEVIGYGLSLLRRSIVLHEEQKGIGPELSKQNIPFFRENRRMLIGPEVEMYALSLYQNLEIPSGVKEKDTSCVMCHVENELKKQQKTAIITLDGNDLITSYEEKPKEPKGNLAVPPFYCYRACDVKRIQEALDNGCGYDAPGSFAAWLSKQTPMYAYVMPGKRYDIGDINSYEYVKSVFSK